jgi:TATA-box binding protein (TBP) (component of TFIID and TFIIIB)
MSSEAMKLLFVAVARPSLEVENFVWSLKLEKNKNLTESVQKRATRIIPGLKNKPSEQIIKIMKFQASFTDICVVTSLKYTCTVIVGTKSQKDVPDSLMTLFTLRV